MASLLRVQFFGSVELRAIVCWLGYSNFLGSECIIVFFHELLYILDCFVYILCGAKRPGFDAIRQYNGANFATKV